jgi:hypothetical protein
MMGDRLLSLLLSLLDTVLKDTVTLLSLHYESMRL